MPNIARQFVSDIVNNLRALNVDDRISYRFVLSKLKDKTKKFIKQDADTRRLFVISEVWKRIPCIEMKEIPFVECGFDVPQCKKIMKSCIKIPETYQTTFGNLLKIFTINGEKEFVQTSLHAYKEIKRRELVDKNVAYFMIIEGYIYIPDSEVEEVMGWGLFTEPVEATKCSDPSPCLSPLDEVFACPEYLIDLVKTETEVELLKLYKPVVVDENPNLNTNRK